MELETHPDPAVGTKYLYKSGEIVVSTFVYNPNKTPIPDGIHDEVHTSEFEDAIRGFAEVSRQQGQHDLKFVIPPPSLFPASDNQTEWYLWTLIGINETDKPDWFSSLSHILVRGDAGNFNKIRCSYPADLGDLALQELGVFAPLWSQAHQATAVPRVSALVSTRRGIP